MRAISVMCLVAGLVVPAVADTVSLPARLDNTLYEDATGSVSNGVGPYLYAGKNSRGTVRRGLVSFDVSSIPAGSVVTGARLTLFTDLAATASTVQELHRVLATWGEGTSNGGNPGGAGDVATAGDATWLHRFYSTQSWLAAGGDFAAAASASKTVSGTGFISWSGTGMVGDVQSWLNGSATNAGWALLGNESVSGSAVRFASREHSVVADRPVLQVDFTPAPAPGGLLAAGIGACLVGRRRR